MSDEKKKPNKKKASDRGLGRGLSALMADISVPSDDVETSAGQPPLETKSVPSYGMALSHKKPETEKRAIQFISIARLTRNPDQPRKRFDQRELEELTESIKEKGLLQPILVRPLPESERSRVSKKADYQIVAGERRWQASLKAGLSSMPVLIRELTDQEVLEIGVVENVQRADLSPIEEARAYKALMEDFGRTQADVSDAVGKSRPHVANLMKLLDLPGPVQMHIARGRISQGHAKALANVPDAEALATRIVEEGLSVRETEKIAKALRDGEPVSPPKPKSYKDPNIIKVESDLTDALGLAVDLRDKGGAGEVRIKYKTAKQLEALMQRLKE
ncbi:ParB/RepB/Spo0J family partition protein [Litorimonas sp. WD9-15]|uniref:ParB/RepB/Spo0J family partition protein n=1 Tax=Litorimonas sp. WD9-15 TaxID=3418716 RepID=UPI003CFC9D9C